MSEVVAQPTGELVVTRVELPVAAGSAHRRDEHGMVSAEWAVGLIAAIAIAGVLLGVVTNGAVKTALLKFILLVISAFSNGI
jgi:hypothetical protein